MSDSTPTAVVAEIDEDRCLHGGARQSAVLFSQGKRHGVEMNASSSVGDPRCAGTDVKGMRMEDDIDDLDEAQAQEPDSERLKEGHAAKDLLDQLRHDASVRDQRMAERMAERDAAAAAALTDRDAAMVTKLERLMRTLSESVMLWMGTW